MRKDVCLGEEGKLEKEGMTVGTSEEKMGTENGKNVELKQKQAGEELR